MELETLSSEDINDMTLEAPETEEETFEAESDFTDVSIDETDTEGDEENALSRQDLESLFDMYFSENKELAEAETPLVLAAPSPAGTVSFDNSDLMYRLEINNSEYTVLFPADARQLLRVNNGYLVNMGSSNITGVVLSSSDTLSISNYHQRFYTLYPITQTGAQNNLYRYNASGYITIYSPGAGNNLSQTQSYGNAEVIETPGIFSGYSQFNLIVMAALALLIVIQFINGLFRR